MDPVTLARCSISGKTAARWLCETAGSRTIFTKAVFERKSVSAGRSSLRSARSASAPRRGRRQEQDALLRNLTEAVQAEGHFLVLFQPFYQVGAPEHRWFTVSQRPVC